ncbi:MAG: hypothetical protein P4L10_10895 [Acidobacteriaceae bacterium]|nr:hypothetical protein [Acidobacteriaceae bacterium]
MAGISHYFGNDLSFSATGDLATVSDADLTTQRILRRILTAPGGYIWNPTYGCGLPSQIGQPTNVMAVQNAIRAQIFQEATVAKAPEPVITLTGNPDGTFVANIIYTDAPSGQTKTLTVPVS